MRPDRVRVRHMLDAAREVEGFIVGRSRENLDEDQMLVRAVTKSIEIIGEVASRVSAEFRATHPEIPWQDAVSMRNRLVHGYFDINLDTVWSTATEELPQLIPLLERVLGSSEES
jgi:uncharacterized protein with HEPN domain